MSLPSAPQRRLAFLLAALAGALGGPGEAQQARRAHPRITLEGTGRLWQTLTLRAVTGLDTDELLHAPGENPFLDVRMRVVFRHPASGTEEFVQGFYGADGDAADTGASAGPVWMARFAPDHVGEWTWEVAFRRGPGLALDPNAAGIVADPRIDGAFGSFYAAPADPAAPGFLAAGRLEHVDEPYLRFAGSGEPYLKNGAGGPENFLAYYEFDGTTGDTANACLAAPQHLHRFDAHAGDYTGDAVDLAHTWGPGERGRNILGAIDWLASRGVNSLYFLTNSYRGDGKDVWPWVAPQDKLHYDVSKLEQWERFFEHMSARGVQIQLVFEEGENDQLSVPNGGLGNGLTPERRLYYRELVARFAHHPAVIWVIGDESNYFDEIAVMESLASEIRSLDPYHHPITFHCKHPCYGSECPEPFPSVFGQYQPYFGFTAFEATCFQTAPGGYNTSTIQLRQGQVGLHPWAHFGDEQSLNATAPNLFVNRTKALWGNLMGGGSGVAWYPGNDVPAQYPPGTNICDYFDLTVEDMRVFEDYFVQTRHAIELFRAELPFTEMHADNALASPHAAEDYVFVRSESALAEIKAVYAVYRGTGTAATLAIGAGAHSVEWFNPRTGAGPQDPATFVGPDTILLVPPGEDPGLDWLAVVRQE